MMRPTPDILAQAGQGDVDAMAAAMGPQGSKYMTLVEMTAAIEDWSKSYETQREALDGLRIDWGNGGGSYLEDWEDVAPAEWQAHDLLAAIRLVREGLEAVMTQSIVNIQTSDLMTALSEAAGELANFPAATWGGWIAYFLEELQVADDGTSVATGDYDDMLNEISATIAHRIARGGW